MFYILVQELCKGFCRNIYGTAQQAFSFLLIQSCCMLQLNILKTHFGPKFLLYIICFAHQIANQAVVFRAHTFNPLLKQQLVRGIKGNQVFGHIVVKTWFAAIWLSRMKYPFWFIQARYGWNTLISRAQAGREGGPFQCRSLPRQPMKGTCLWGCTVPAL